MNYNDFCIDDVLKKFNKKKKKSKKKDDDEVEVTVEVKDVEAITTKDVIEEAAETLIDVADTLAPSEAKNKNIKVETKKATVKVEKVEKEKKPTKSTKKVEKPSEKTSEEKVEEVEKPKKGRPKKKKEEKDSSFLIEIY